MQSLRAARRRLEWDRTATSTAQILVVFIVLDRAILRFAELPDQRLGDRSLVLAAVRSHWLMVLALLVVVAAVRPRGLIGLRWAHLSGRLRWFAAAPLAVLVWRRAAAAHDYVFAEWHAVDRILLVAVAIAALARPVALVGFVVLARLLAAPVVSTIAAPGANIDELAILVLLIIGAAALLRSRNDSFVVPAVIPVMVAAFSAQFFLPGRIKLRSGWAWHNEMGNLPLNGYGQGWLGSGSGDFARGLSELIADLEPLLAAGTLVFEVGAVLAVLSRRLTITWLVVALAFHAAVMASLGFLFIEFAAVELGLIALIGTDRGRSWSRAAFHGAAPLLAAIAVVLGPIVFHPPSLAWFDSDAVVRYEVDAVDVEGRRWALEASDFAPYTGLMAFSALELGPTPPAVSAYGAASRNRFTEIQQLSDLDELERFEAGLPGDCRLEDRAKSMRLLERFLITGGSQSFLDRLSAPEQFATSRPGPDYSGTPLRELQVTRLTILRTDGDTLERRQDVLRMARPPGSSVVELEWSTPGICSDPAG